MSLDIQGMGHVAYADLGLYPFQLEDQTMNHMEAQINQGGPRYRIRRYSDQAGHSRGLEVASWVKLA